MCKDILFELCGILSANLRNGLRHLDLSPSNIILKRDGKINADSSDEENWIPYLIDFGRNYLLTERVGSGYAFAQAQIYIAPELLKGEQGTAFSDVYSLGMIFLALLSESRPDPLGISAHLDSAWSKYPDFAMTVSEMIDVKPEFRVLDAEADVYDTLSAQIETKFKLYKEVVDNKNEDGCPVILKLLAGRSSSALKLFSGLYKRMRALNELKNRKEAASFGRLCTWALIAQGCHIVNLSAVFFFFFVALQSENRYLQGSAFFADRLGTWKTSLPGFFVAITFSSVAVRYYLNIMSGFDVRGLSLKTEIILRINAACVRTFCLSFVVFYRPICEMV